MVQKVGRKVPLNRPIFPDRSRPSADEIERRKAESHAFAQRCREIFRKVAPELMTKHYGWSIIIEPDSGDYFIDPSPETALQQAKEKHPHAVIMEMCLNEYGTCGRI